MPRGRLSTGPWPAVAKAEVKAGAVATPGGLRALTACCQTFARLASRLSQIPPRNVFMGDSRSQADCSEMDLEPERRPCTQNSAATDQGAHFARRGLMLFDMNEQHGPRRAYLRASNGLAGLQPSGDANRDKPRSFQRNLRGTGIVRKARRLARQAVLSYLPTRGLRAAHGRWFASPVEAA